MPDGRVNVAFEDNWDEVNPTWTRLDEVPDVNYRVASWTVDRSRQSEVDKTDTGTATVKIWDWSGDFDPTYSGGDFFDLMKPMKQITLGRYNPTNDTWYSRYRGFISRWRWRVYPTQNLLEVTIECKDLLGVLAAAELVTDQHGTDSIAGNVLYEQADQVADRLNAIRIDAGVPSGFVDFFSGNVIVQPTVYSSRGQMLAAIDDACDAEFPGVANRFCNREGILEFHGRLARFHPADVQYGILTWKAGDDTAVADDSDRVPLAGGENDQPFEFTCDENDIINAVYSAPKGILDDDIGGQYVQDTTSKNKYGPHSLSFENLLTSFGYLKSQDANTETKEFGTFFKDNFAEPAVRVPQLSFSTRDRDDPRAEKTWDLLSRIDISDIIDLLTTHVWGGGFGEEQFFVEGIHETQTPMNDREDEVRLTCDLSPAVYYGVNPFEA